MSAANPPTLHLLCGKIAAGKSTLATTLGEEAGSVIVREDDWLASLYPGEQNTLEEYRRNAKRLRKVMGPHVVTLLQAGLSVILDFPANTSDSRAWMRTLFEKADTAHRLHWLDVADERCRDRLRRRNKGGEHKFVVSDDMFDLITGHFEPPIAAEGFVIVHHRA